MEVGRNLLSSSPPFPLRTHLRNSSPLVSMLHEQGATAVTYMPTTSISRHFPASVLLQEQRDECKPLLHMVKEDKTSQATLDTRQMETFASFHEEKTSCETDQYLKDFERQLLYGPGLSYLLASSYKEKSLLSFSMQSITTNTNNDSNVKPCDALSLAKKALVASKHAASLVEDSELYGADLDESFPGLSSTKMANQIPVEEQVAVRSTRLLERRSKKRRVSKSNPTFGEVSSSRRADMNRKLNEGFDQTDPLRLFLWGPDTKQLLTAKEESELFVRIQELTRLEDVKSRLQSEFDREPTIVEWAQAVGMSCRDLKSYIHTGNSSRQKMVYANSRMVVHVAKQYLGWGMNLQDLLQEGSMGLMKSIEKFKPQAGCRFSTYAYWWIRQSVRRAIFQNSRTIRLPENVYNLLRQVRNAKKVYIQEGHYPTKEELAKSVGMTVEKLEMLLLSTKVPLSMQQPVWTDQNTTFQEITADTGVEITSLSVEKKLMRRHVRNLLSILSPKERRIIRLRFGIEDGKEKSLAEIGSVFGLSKERVRQLESRALAKLRQCFSSQGLGAYTGLLT